MKESFYLVHPFVFVILNSSEIVLTISLFLLLPCAESGPAELAGTGFHGVTHERQLSAKDRLQHGVYSSGHTPESLTTGLESQSSDGEAKLLDVLTNSTNSKGQD